jgi:MYXO-CTERM domain-containing protein
MRRIALAPFALSLAPLLAGFAAASPAPTASIAAPVIETVTRPGSKHPWLAVGTLTPASTQPVEVVAKDALRLHAAWSTRFDLHEVAQSKTKAGATIVEYGQRLAGLPVFGRGAKVYVEADRRVTTVSTSIDESAVPTVTRPAFDAARALEIAVAAGVPARADWTRLGWSSTDGAPRLVYGLVGDLGAIPSRPVVIVDALTGEIVTRWDATVHARKAAVFAKNPVATPTTSEVTLLNDPSLPGLATARVATVNCIDKKNVRELFAGIRIHVCDFIPTIQPDASGDYLEVKPAGDRDPEDAYAELSMFHHTERAYDFAIDNGFPTEKVTKVTAVANVRIPDGIGEIFTNPSKAADPNRPLQPFDNAAFTPAGNQLFETALGLSGDLMTFGQGTTVDFGYDGEVVYHEFGHFIVSRTIALRGPTWADEYGITVSPGALNEAIADIYSFLLSQDPELGEYVGRAIGAPAGKGMRSALTDHKFPTAFTGEVHADGEPVAAAVWAVYGPLDAGKKASFAKAFMKTLVTAPPGDLGYADFAELLGKTVAADLGADVGAALKSAFESRGIKAGDARVIVANGPIRSVEYRLGFAAPGTGELTKGGKLAPGIVQFRSEAPAGKVKISLGFTRPPPRGGFGGAPAGGGFGGQQQTPYAPVLLAKVGDEPIKFTYAGKETTTDAQQAVCTVDADGGACAIEVDVPGVGDAKAPVHLMIGNTGQSAGDYDDVKITAELLAPPVDPGPQPDPGATPGSGETGSAGGGCGCTVPGSTTTNSAGALALAALGLAITTRRRR